MTTTSSTSAQHNTNPWLQPSKFNYNAVKIGGRCELYAEPTKSGSVINPVDYLANRHSVHWKSNHFLAKEHFHAIEFLKGEGSAEALLNKYLSGDLSRIEYINSVLVNRVRATNPEKAKRMVSRMTSEIIAVLVKEGVLPRSYAQLVDNKQRDEIFATDLGL